MMFWRWEDDLRDEAIELMIREPRPEVDDEDGTDAERLARDGYCKKDDENE